MDAWHRQPPPASGIRWPWAALVTLLTGILAGCGFHLRGMIQLPPAMQPLYVDCQPGIPFELCNQVKSSLTRNGIQVATAKDHAYRLALTRIETDQRANAITQQATAAAYELRMRVWSKLSAPDGMPILADSPVRTTETYRYDETNILGKRREEQALYKTLYGRIAQQILFRLRPLTESRLKALRRNHSKASGNSAENNRGAPAPSQ